MRIFAGEAIQADMLCEGRLVVGVGRGAFAYELERLGTSITETRTKFDESLVVLQALFSREELPWYGTNYKFEPLTVMPRPISPIPLQVAAMAQERPHQFSISGLKLQTK